MNCPNCGAPIDERAVGATSEYKPISMWGYFGYEILFSIPLIGFILLIVFAFGGTKNVNLKNFARSYFCYTIIVAIIAGVIIGSLAGAGALAGLTSLFN